MYRDENISDIDMISVSSGSDDSMIPVLNLAFFGDGVYSCMVREMLVGENKTAPGKIHQESTKYVSAVFQSELAGLILGILDEKEMTVFKRGRNAHTSHTPKNASEAQYHRATGLETLFGYLYITKKFDRLKELFAYIYKLRED